ncbi:MAG: PucR family transcriptional regulator [Firmicutes bacterium]|nr:PucR family transcriptional regulator [Bacillota bacterium]
MLKVIDLLSLDEFESFKLISDSKGLYNNVAGTGILDWETPKEIAKDFHKDDFVFITLYMIGQEPENMEERFKALFKVNVAAIGIKVPDQETFPIPQEIVDLANTHRTPLFTYTEAYLEDLIFAIRSAVFYNDANRVSLDYLRFLMDSSEDMTASIAKKLNPLFNDNLVCYCCIPAAEETEPALDRALEDYRKTLTHNLYIYKSGDAFIRCNRCLMIIYTSEDAIPDDAKALEQILDGFHFDREQFCTGASSAKAGLGLLQEAVTEAVSAAISAFIGGERLQLFTEIGSDGLIIPTLDSRPHMQFYRKTLRAITDYDEKHSAHLLETLLCYIDSESDVALTAKNLFQHGNTIRYRLEKIKTILGISLSTDAYVQLYMFAKMHKIYSILKEEPLI